MVVIHRIIRRIKNRKNMKTELVYCDLTDCIYHENSKEEYHLTMSEPAPPICRLRAIRLVGGQCCEYDEAEV